MAVEIISWSIFTKVWDWAEMELATPGSAVRHLSAVRHVTDCVKQPGMETFECNYFDFLPVVQEAMFFKVFSIFSSQAGVHLVNKSQSICP